MYTCEVLTDTLQVKDPLGPFNKRREICSRSGVFYLLQYVLSFKETNQPLSFAWSRSQIQSICSGKNGILDWLSSLSIVVTSQLLVVELLVMHLQ